MFLFMYLEDLVRNEACEEASERGPSGFLSASRKWQREETNRVKQRAMPQCTTEQHARRQSILPVFLHMTRTLEGIARSE